ncbi:hypothetical protein FACS1894158_02000 [Betaproteobacteria bacterium]|nr:hypothetical protein FACS1894158_02000 [Betaproteobacteria bacterium]
MPATGRPKLAHAPSGGSDPQGSVGVVVPATGRPKLAHAPSGGVVTVCNVTTVRDWNMASGTSL